MHVCYVGGTGPFLRGLAEGAAARGCDVTVLAFYDANLGPYLDPTGWAGVQVLKIPRHLKWRYPSAAATIATHLRQLEPDIFHCHYAFPYGMYGATSLHSGFVLSLHGTDAYYSAWRRASGMTRKLDAMGAGRPAFLGVHHVLARRAKRVTLGSPDLVEVSRQLGYPSDRIRECDIGVDASVFHPGLPEADLRGRLLAPLENGHVLFSARAFKDVYGYADLVHALPKVLDRYPDTVLALAGQGNPEGTIRLAERLGVASNVRIVGPIPHSDVARYMRASDVLCSVAYSDTTSMTVLEGMAVGLPIVATKVGSIPIRLSKTDGGILVDPGNRNGISEALQTLLSDADLRRSMGQRNCSYVASQLSFDDTVRRTIAVYREIA